MPLPTTLVDIPVATGIDEHTDRRLSVRMRSLLNARVLHTGAIEKRAGTACIALTNTRFDATTPPTPEGLIAYGGELLRAGKGQLDTYWPNGSTSDWILKDRYPSILAKRVSVSPFGQFDCDLAYCDGYLVVVYLSRSEAGTDQICADVVNVETGAHIFSRHVIASETAGTITNPKVATVGSRVVIGYRKTTTLLLDSLNLSTMTWVGATFALAGLVTVDVGDGRWDLTGTPTEAIVVVETELGSNRVKLARYNPATLVIVTTITTLSGVSTTGHTALCVHYGYYTGRVHVGLGVDDTSNTLVKVLALSADLTTVHYGPTTAIAEATGGTVFNVGIVDTDTQNVWVGATYRTGTTGTARIRSNAVGSSGSVIHSTTDGPRVERAVLISKPWIIGLTDPRVHAAVINDHSTHGTGFVVDFGQYTENVKRMAATFAPRQMGNQNGATLASVIANRRGISSLSGTGRSGDYVYASFLSGGEPDLPYRRSVEALRVKVTNVGVMAVDTGRALVLAGGCPSIYDRQQVSELGFAYEPDERALTLTGSTTGGGHLTLLKQYNVRLVYSWTDALGDTHRSAPSNAISATLAGTENTLTLAGIPSLHLTNRVESSSAAAVLIEVYSTEGDGEVFYLNKTLVSTVGGVDQSTTLTQADSTLRRGRILYSTSGQLDHVIPPSSAIVHMHQGAVILGGCDTDAVWISLPVVEGDGLSFNDGLVIPPFEGGEITSLMTLDDVLVTAKADSIWIVQGGLPGENGLPTPAPPRRLESDVGCTQARGVRNAGTEGVLFPTTAGYAMLKRDFSVVLVGKPIETTLGTSPTDATPQTITSAVAMPSESIVRLTYGQFAVNYDYLNGNSQQPFWTVNSYLDATVSEGSAIKAIVGACLWQGRWTYVNADGKVFQESLTTWKDTATGHTSRFVSMAGTSHPINVSGIAGWQRTRRLHVVFNAFSDAVEFTFGPLFEDASPSVLEDVTFSIPVTASSANLEREKHIGQQKSRSFAVSFSDAASLAGTTTGRGIAIAGFVVEAGTKKGTSKLAAASRG